MDMNGFAIYESPLGWILMEYAEGAITHFTPIANKPTKKGQANTLTEQAYQQLTEYLQGKRKIFDFPYILKGTPFQKKVWQALLTIPYGQTRSYKDIAVAIGNAKAARAVGMANHHNPLVIVVPCHRVIGANGKAVGYAHGLAMKAFLLDLEKAHP